MVNVLATVLIVGSEASGGGPGSGYKASNLCPASLLTTYGVQLFAG